MLRATWNRLLKTRILFPRKGSRGSNVRRRAVLRAELLEHRQMMDAGALDLTFDGDGIVTTPFDHTARGTAVAVQADGKIVVAGNVFNRNADFALSRYDTNGALDPTFGIGGKVELDLDNSEDFVHSIAIQSDGKILIAGNIFKSKYSMAIVRLNSDGSLDPTFDVDGKLFLQPIAGSQSSASALALQQDGKIVVAGLASENLASRFAIVRLNTSGSLDNTFDGDGVATIPVGSQLLTEGPSNVSLQPDGKIVVAGSSSSTDGRTSSIVLARFHPNGAFDNSFGISGKVFTRFDADYSGVSDMAIQADGKIVLAGSSSSSQNFYIARFDALGTLDPSFDGDGIAAIAVTPGSNLAASVAILNDGKIVVAGTSDDIGGAQISSVRLNANGSLDVSYDFDGKAITAIGNSSGTAKMAIQSDGKIVIAGSAVVGSPRPQFALVRIEGSSSPSDLLLSRISIAENQRVGSQVGVLSSVDPDSLDQFTYSLVSGAGSTDNGRFAIVGNSLTALESFDFEARSSYSIRIRTTDQTGKSFEKSFIVSIENLIDDYLVTAPGAGLAAITGSVQSSQGALSSDGNSVAFITRAANIVPGDTNDRYDVFVRDLAAGTTERVSVGAGGVQGNSDSGLFSGNLLYPSISADGRYVAYASSANNLTANDPNFTIDVFRYDRVTHTTALVSATQAGVVGNSDSYMPSISADGSKIAFLSRATNFTPDVFSNVFHIFVKDMNTGALTFASKTQSGTLGNANSDDPCLSPEGNFVFFASSATNLVTGDTNGSKDFFRKDLSTGEIVRVNVGSLGTESVNIAAVDHIVSSSDGRYAAFGMYSNNLGNGVFVKDLQTQQLRQITTGDGALQSWGAAISGDGRYVSFGTSRSLLSADTNNDPDYYRYDLNTSSLALMSVDNAGVVGRYDPNSNTSLLQRTSISNDGRSIMFASNEIGLVTPDTNNSTDVFVHHILIGGDTIVESTEAASLHAPNLASSSGSGPDLFTGDYLSGEASSFDGRYVVFGSGRTDYVPNDTNGFQDIYRRDRLNNVTTRVNVYANGAQSTRPAYTPAISPDGRYVAFSTPEAFDPRDFDGTADIYVKDTLTGAIRLVSYPSSIPNQDTGQTCDSPNISGLDASGNYYVTFTTYRKMVAEDTNGITDLYRWYSGDARLELVSKTASGVVGNSYTLGFSTNQISTDGRFLVFGSSSSNLVPNDTNNAEDIFLKDMTTGAITRLSVDTDGSQFRFSPAGSFTDSRYPSISSDGNVVQWTTFTSAGVNLYVRNIQTNSLIIGNTNQAGVRSTQTQASYTAKLSGNGRYLAFVDGSLLTPGPWQNAAFAAYVKDLQTGAVVRTDVRSGPVADTGLSTDWPLALSGDGKTVFFRTGDTNFIANDFNLSPDMFARQWDLPPTAVKDLFWARPNAALNVSAANGVLKNDTEPDGSTMKAVLQTAPNSGTLVLNADGSFTYTPVANFEGQVSFSYWATDGFAYSEPVTAIILVERDNADLAVAVASTAASANIGDSVSYSVSAMNRGPLDSPGTVLTTRIPFNSTLVSATGAYTFANNTLTWNLGTLPNGAKSVQYFTVQVASIGSTTAFAKISGSLPDFDLGNNASTDNAPSGLRDLWRAEESPVDSVGAVPTALENGAGYLVRGYRDSGFAFDGVDDSVAVNSINLGSTYSVEFWAHPTRSSGFEHLISNDYRSANFGAIYFRDNHLEYWQGSASKVTTPVNSVALNAWTHVALTYDGTNTRLYVNGVLSGTSAAHVAPFNNPVRFGYAIGASDLRFRGRLDEISFYDRVLNPTEISAVKDVPKLVAGSAPSQPSLTSSSINENRAAGSQIGSVFASDVDEVDAQVVQLVSGTGGADNGLFRIDQNKLSILVKPNFEAKSQYSIRVRVTDAGRNTIEVPLTVTVNDLLEVEQTLVGDGSSSQRSMVQQIVVRFDHAVEYSAGAFTVNRRSGNGLSAGVVASAVDLKTINGKTQATLTFNGTYTRDAFGTLVDGFYELVVDGTKVRLAGSLALLDGNADGDEAGNYGFGSSASDRFFAFYGDLNGDGVVGNDDYDQFKLAYGKSSGQAGYRRELDYLGVGLIRVFDFNEFRKRFGKTLQF